MLGARKKGEERSGDKGGEEEIWVSKEAGGSMSRRWCESSQTQVGGRDMVSYSVYELPLYHTCNKSNVRSSI